MRAKFTWLTVALAVVIPATASGDLFRLTTGGQLEGELLNRDESPREKYVVRTASGGEVTLTKKQVERRVVLKEAEKEYEERLHGLPNTVEDHLKIAEWCRASGLDSHREFHMQEVLKLDTNNETARHALGFARRNSKWVTTEDVMRNQGLLRYKGKWWYPQELEIVTAREKYEQAALEWKRKVRQLRGKIVDRGDTKAIEELREIEEPLAGPILIDLLGDKKEPSRLKLLYIEVLSKMGGSNVIFAFVQSAVLDDDEQVRDRCLSHLEKGSNRVAARLFARYLSDNNPRHINRAGEGLGRMGITDYTPEMISALVTKHSRIVGGGSGGGGMGLSVSGDGGLSIGGNRPQKITEISQNEGVLAALASMYPGTNFVWNVDAWRDWWVHKTTPREVRLRRSE